MPREINYKVGLDTNEARTQLMQMQSQITNTVNQSHRAVNNVTSTDSTSLEHARRQQASMDLPSPYGEPFGVGNFKKRTQMEKMQGGYHYKPSFVGAGSAVMGLGSAPTGVPDYKWQQQNQEIFQERTGDLAERAGTMAAGGVAGTVGYLAPEMPGIKQASAGAGKAVGHAARGAGGVVGKAISPLQKLPGGGAVKGLRSIGAAIGNKLPGAGKMLGPMIAGGAASIAAFSSVTGGAADVGTRRGFEQQLSHISPSFITSDVKPGMGSGFDMDERNEIASFMTDIQNDSSISAGGLSSLMKGGAKIGRFNGVETVKDFKEEFSKLVNEVKEVTSNLRMTLDEGVSTIDNLRSMGVSSAGEMNSVTNRMRARAGISGQTTRDMMNTFNKGANMFSKMGFDPAAGGNMLTNVNANVMNKVKGGEISPVELRQKGGVQGMTQSIAGDLTRAMTQGSIGNLLVSALGNDNFTGVDPTNVQSLLSAGANPSAAQTMANENLSSQQARSNFKANKDQVTSDLLSSPLSPYFIGAMTKKSLNQAGIDPTRPNMEIALRNQGIKNTDQFLDVATDPEYARKQMRERKRVAFRDAISDMEPASGSAPAGAIANAGNALYDVTVDPAKRAASAVGRETREAGEYLSSLVRSSSRKPEYREARLPDFTEESLRRNSDRFKKFLQGGNVRGYQELPGVGVGSAATAMDYAHNDWLGSTAAYIGYGAENVVSWINGSEEGISGWSLNKEAGREAARKIHSQSDHPFFRKIAKAQLEGGNVKRARNRMRDVDIQKKIFEASNDDIGSTLMATVGTREGKPSLKNVVSDTIDRFTSGEINEGKIDNDIFKQLANEASQKFFEKNASELNDEQLPVLSKTLMKGIQNADDSLKIADSLAASARIGGSNVKGNRNFRSLLKAQSGAIESLKEAGLTDSQAERLEQMVGGNSGILESFESTLDRFTNDEAFDKEDVIRRIKTSTDISEEDAEEMHEMILDIYNSDEQSINKIQKKISGNQELKNMLETSGDNARVEAFARTTDQIVQSAYSDNNDIKSYQDLLSKGKGVSDLVEKMNVKPSDKFMELAKNEMDLTGDTQKLAAAAMTKANDQETVGGVPNDSIANAKQMEKVLDQVAELDKLASSIDSLAGSVAGLDGA